MRGVEEEKAGIMTIGDLMSESWYLYKERLCTLLGIMLLGGLVFFVIAGVYMAAMLASMTLGIQPPVWLIMAGLFIIWLLMFAAQIWFSAAFFYAAAVENIGCGGALKKTRPMLFSFFWVMLLWGFITMGGFGLFIVPGFIFMTWFAFAPYIYLLEDERGMKALIKSKEYVRGRWVEVFVRLFLVGAIYIGLMLIPLLGIILAFFYIPFMLIYAGILYEDLRKEKGLDFKIAPSFMSRCKWVAAGALGHLVSILLPALLFGALILSLIGSYKDKNILDLLMKPGELKMPDIMEKIPFKLSPGAIASDVWIRISAVNYRGNVKLNGKKVFTFGGVKGLKYNYSSDDKIVYGLNSFEIRYTPVAGGAVRPNIIVTVYKPVRGGSEKKVLYEWMDGGKGGVKKFAFVYDRETGVQKPRAAKQPPAQGRTGRPAARKARDVSLRDLQGTWSGAEKGSRQGTWTISFKGTSLDAVGPSENESYMGKVVSIDSQANPKMIDIKITGSRAGQVLGKTSLGIFKMEGSLLTLCSSRPGSKRRPSSFHPKGGSRCFDLISVPPAQ